MTGFVNPWTPQFYCANGSIGLYPVELHAPSNFGTVAALITLTPFLWTNSGFVGQLSQSPNQYPGIKMNAGTWAWSSGGVWSAPKPGWYELEVSVQWYYVSPTGLLSLYPFARVDVKPSTPTDYAATYTGQIYGVQVCSA